MSTKKLIAYVNAENEIKSNVIDMCVKYANSDADEIYIYNYSKEEDDKENLLLLARELSKLIDIPFILGMRVKRLEDIKKMLYTGAKKVMIKMSYQDDINIVKEGSERFGKDKIVVLLKSLSSESDSTLCDELKALGACAVMVESTEQSDGILKEDIVKNVSLPVYLKDGLVKNDIHELLSINNVEAVVTDYYSNKSILSVKKSLIENGINIKKFESSMNFSEFTLNSDGLLPVVVQDYTTQEVLMVAYMNEESFNNTIETGCMTYYSRSRKELWVKGETSGHYQYVKELRIDCDNDTLLAKVKQIGGACHTGNNSCFYREIAKREYDETNPYKVLNEVFDVILDRKKNPKEGSYTNYLFDKGIDKILKKCGEEATEIVIAAKNPDPEEIKYEISDFLYHMMVLMAEKGLTLDDITSELAHRK